jgi:hypothetical protein
MTPLFIVFYRLRVAGAGLAVGPGGGSWDLGPGREWDVFCRDVFADAQPRDHVAAAAVSDFDSGAAGYGAGYYGYTRWRGARFWIVLLATYDLVFTTVCLLLFETCSMRSERMGSGDRLSSTRLLSRYTPEDFDD